jgi:hypothetical protein
MTHNRDITASVENDAASHTTVSAESHDTRDEGQEYDVERIVGEKIAPGIHEFLIEWVGYTKLDWIPAEDCFCPDKISEFRAAQRADLIEATEAGRNAEAENLRGLADAERLRSQSAVATKPKLPIISSFNRMRDPNTGRFLTVNARVIELVHETWGVNTIQMRVDRKIWRLTRKNLRQETRGRIQQDLPPRGLLTAILASMMLREKLFGFSPRFLGKHAFHNKT